MVITKSPIYGVFCFWALTGPPKTYNCLRKSQRLFFFVLKKAKAMKQAPDHLVDLIEPIVEGLGYECVGIEYNPHPQHGMLRIYIDSEQGILLDDCTKVSHQLSGMLDVEDPIPGEYQLEISSPGEDRPFFKLSQFQTFIGSTVMVNLFKPIDKRRKITGQIQSVEGDDVVLQEGDQTFRVAFSAMSKARLVPDYLLKKGGHSGK
jgi:ribosome maturation factor RimP